jgi:hypothetical protein
MSGVDVMTGQQVLVIRPWRTRWMAGSLAVLLVAAFTFVGIALRGSKTGAIFQTSDQIAMICVGILLGAGTLLFAMPRVRADAEGIEVRNVLLGRRFAWHEVLSVAFPDGASWARLELPDDEYYPMMAVQAVDRDRAVAAVRALRLLHKRAWDKS